MQMESVQTLISQNNITLIFSHAQLLEIELLA